MNELLSAALIQLGRRDDRIARPVNVVSDHLSRASAYTCYRSACVPETDEEQYRKYFDPAPDLLIAR